MFAIDREQGANEVPSSSRSRPLIFSCARKIDWTIGSPSISFDRLTAKRDRITGQSTAGIKRSLVRFGLLAFDLSTTNHCWRHARWFLQMAPSPYQSFLLQDKDRYKSSSYLSNYRIYNYRNSVTSKNILLLY